MQYDISIIREITGAELIQKANDLSVKELLIDSRKIAIPSASLFFAIKGERHDGHQYVKELYDKGVRSFVLEQVASDLLPKIPEANVLKVTSAIAALQLLSAAHRKQFKIPIIGITGSNAKTIVKEWLSQILSKEYSIVKSPKSYNSQVGVPLSVWQINAKHEMGIFEAGISLPGEMEKLHKVIQPDIGIFTNIGTAHDEGFTDKKQKIQEKLKLFAQCKLLIYCKDHQEIDALVKLQKQWKTLTWSATSKEADLLILNKKISGANTNIRVQSNKEQFELSVPFTDDASIENLMHCVALLFSLGKDLNDYKESFAALHPIAMRMELKEAQNGSFLIDDTYNNDLAGLNLALNFLDQQQIKTKKTIILSDLYEAGMDEELLYDTIARMLNAKKLYRLIGIGKQLSKYESKFKLQTECYNTTEDFLKTIGKESFLNELILIKGARVFRFERIVQSLQARIHNTVFEINLDALSHNLNFYRSKLQPETKMMVMVKAFAYGSGSHEVANLLQFHRVDYLAVAYADEGVYLRDNGITIPIMVMNPSEHTFEKMLTYDLEPEIYSFGILKDLTQYLRDQPLSGESIKIHLKLDTGMHRLGFEEKDVEKLITSLKSINVKVLSIFSHLAGADENTFDDFTQKQISVFTKMADQIEQALGYPVIRHILNSAGILRFPKAQFGMVRLGIGLYGVEAGREGENNLLSIGTLKTYVSQVRTVAAGESIGYSRKGLANAKMKIATVAIGYADGYDRRFSNGVGKMLIHGKVCPVIGNVCMDMTMVDVTALKNVEEGDEVIVFGKELSVSDLAKEIQTIPYEILTGVNERVKRVYFTE